MPKKLKNEAFKHYINSVLNQNAHLNFVQRIQEPKKYPNIDLGEGYHGTHLMSWGRMGETPIVYPQIVQDTSGELKRLEPNEAYDYAVNSGEFIPFNSDEDADWFSQNYKQVWE